MIDVAFVHFGAVDHRYLDAAWYSLSRQDFTGVSSVTFYDNSSGQDRELLMAVLDRHTLPPHIPLRAVFDCHNDPDKRCQSYSVNAAVRATSAPWVLFTRSDYILDFTLVERFNAVIQGAERSDFVTSYAYHMAFDARGDQRIEGFRDIEPTRWRERGAQVFLDEVNGWRVDSSHTDAGVWACRRVAFASVGGLNERLTKWGLQQTVFQQALAERGCTIVQIPEFLFFHQHHGGEFRDYDAAIAQLEAYWGPREKVGTFRNIEQFVGKVNDETPR